VIGVSGKLLCPVCLCDLEHADRDPQVICKWCMTLVTVADGAVKQFHRATPVKAKVENRNVLTDKQIDEVWTAIVHEQRQACIAVLRKVTQHPRLGIGVVRDILSTAGGGSLTIAGIKPNYLRRVMLVANDHLRKWS
jgi:hypothetical protein